jgi:hypothetical protein
MSDNPNLGYYQPSLGSLTGIEQFNIPRDNPNIADTGWSIEQLRRFLLNQSDINFPSTEWLQQIEQVIQEHVTDVNNPHQTTLDQIVSDIVSQIIGSVVPGTPPTTSPFYTFDATANLPLGTVAPATYNPQNLYRRTQTGSIVNAQTEQDKLGVDTTGGSVGVPLYSTMTNNTPVNWDTLPSTLLNTTLVNDPDVLTVYPFTFKAVNETPTVGVFGVNIPITQNLQAAYTTCFYVKASSVEGKIRIYQPSNTSNYIDVNLVDGVSEFYTDTMGGTSVRYADGVIRVCVTFTSSSSLADNALCVVHLNPEQTGNGTRQGSLGRTVFSIAHPQTTQSTLNTPPFVNLSQTASCPTLSLNMDNTQIPENLDSVLMTFSIDIHPTPQISPISDPTILTFDSLIISRDQIKVYVSVEGNTLFTSDILDGVNTFSISYSNSKIIFKDLFGERQVSQGDYPALATANVTFGPFGGYLLNASFYNEVDNLSVVEYLTNG